VLRRWCDAHGSFDPAFSSVRGAHPLTRRACTASTCSPRSGSCRRCNRLGSCRSRTACWHPSGSGPGESDHSCLLLGKGGSGVPSSAVPYPKTRRVLPDPGAPRARSGVDRRSRVADMGMDQLRVTAVGQRPRRTSHPQSDGPDARRVFDGGRGHDPDPVPDGGMRGRTPCSAGAGRRRNTMEDRLARGGAGGAVLSWLQTTRGARRPHRSQGLGCLTSRACPASCPASCGHSSTHGRGRQLRTGWRAVVTPTRPSPRRRG